MPWTLPPTLTLLAICLCGCLWSLTSPVSAAVGPPKIIRTAPIVIPCRECLKCGGCQQCSRGVGLASQNMIQPPQQNMVLPQQNMILPQQKMILPQQNMFQPPSPQQNMILRQQNMILPQQNMIRPPPPQPNMLMQLPAPAPAPAPPTQNMVQQDSEQENIFQFSPQFIESEQQGNVEGGGRTINANLLSGPIASVLASIAAGLRPGALTVDFNGNTNGSLPLPESTPEAAPGPDQDQDQDQPRSRAALDEERKLAYGVCQCAAQPEEADQPSEIEEDSLYSVNREPASASRFAPQLADRPQSLDAQRQTLPSSEQEQTAMLPYFIPYQYGVLPQYACNAGCGECQYASV